MKTTSLSSWTLWACLATLGARSQAQPDINNAPKADNPANRAPRARRPDRNMAPEERQKWIVKRQFSLLGANDATQETLAVFIQNETKARQKLMEKSQPLQNALRAGALPDTQIAALLNSYQVMLEDEKVRRAAVLIALEKTVDLKKSPKIEAALTLAGLIGDGPALNIGGGLGRGLMGGAGIGGRGQNGNGRANRNDLNKAPAQGA